MLVSPFRYVICMSVFWQTEVLQFDVRQGL